MEDNGEKIEQGKRNFILTGGAIAAASMLSSSAEANFSNNGKNGSSWKWLVGTTWCVPQTGTFAYEYVQSSNSMVKQTWQTVYQITGYDWGQFWGRSSSILNGSQYYTALTGMVGPDGFVTLAFKQFGSTSPAVVGYGAMVHDPRVGWTMQNQACYPSSSSTTVQWASMVITKPGDKYWNSLPAIGVSVPDFLSKCPPAPTA